MARVKPKRHGVVTDMTAMCDVAFLLLTFFILTTQFKKPDVEDILTPSSISEKKLDDKNIMTISITSDGRYYFTPIDNNSEKVQILTKMGEKYGVTFSDREHKAFVTSPSIATSMSQIKSYLALSEENRKLVKDATIPMDSINRQLIDWVKFSLDVNPRAQLAIKGDAKAQYPKFKSIFEGLRDIDFYKFVLITSQE